MRMVRALLKPKPIFNLLLFLLSIFATSAHTADIKAHALRIHAGWHHYQNRDDLGSPLKYQGHEQTIGLSYQHHTPTTRHHIQTLFVTGTPRAKAIDKSLTHIYAHLQYGYHRQIKAHHHNAITLWLGGLWDNAFSLRNYHYTENHGETTYELLSSCNISAFETWRINAKHKIILGTYFPLLTYISRSHYALYDETFLDEVIEGKSLAFAVLKDGKLTSFHDFFKCNLHLTYDYAITPSLTTGIQYQWTYYRYNKPKPTATLTNEIAITTTFKF